MKNVRLSGLWVADWCRFVDLAVVKEFSVGSGAAVDVVSLYRRQTSGGGGVSGASSGSGSGSAAAVVAAAAVAAGACATSTRPSNCLTVMFGVGLADNRVVEFVAPSHVGRLWKRGLTRLVDAHQRRVGQRTELDRRVQWLKEQYLQLYFDGGRCHGPTPADAVRVRDTCTASVSSYT